jgi:hypothetical protein
MPPCCTNKTDEKKRQQVGEIRAQAWHERGVLNNAQYLLDELIEDRAFGDQLAASSGLCIPHFQLAWRSPHTQPSASN